jgi:glycogen operon protein
VRNLLASLFLSQGVPLLLAGDEIGHSQSGNNNAYCQDNELAWIDWSLLERNGDLLRFVRQLTDLRRSRLWLRRDTFLKGTRRAAATRDIAWLHPSGREMTEKDWNDDLLRCLALQMAGVVDSRVGSQADLLAVFNADAAPVDMLLPQAAHGVAWQVVLDTSKTGDEVPRVLHCSEMLRLEPRSTMLLESRELAG